ncbi:MAG: GntR family transcriptional regulator [Planctomycetota bacterium]
MQIKLSDDGVPLYQQVVEQIRHRILSRQLRGGDELPPIRTLAAKLRVNPNTIARAYRELEVSGLVEKRRTRGTFVTDSINSLSQSKRRAMLNPAMDQLIELSRGLGFQDDELLHCLTQRLPRVSKQEVS